MRYVHNADCAVSVEDQKQLLQPLIDTVLKERKKQNRKGASDLSLSYQAANVTLVWC
jgi:hypothetical protein